MKVIYEHKNFPTTHQQKMGGQLIAEINGSRYKVVFNLDCSYPEQSSVLTSVIAKDEGWRLLLVQPGTENPVVNRFHAMQPHEQGRVHKTGALSYDVAKEMRNLIKLAAEMNG